MLAGQTLGGNLQSPMPLPIHQFVNGGTLANLSSQVSVTSKERSFFEASTFFESFSGGIPAAASSSMLSDLKRKAFPQSGRNERIARSLAALNAVQPTQLRPSEWKRIVEADIEDQY